MKMEDIDLSAVISTTNETTTSKAKSRQASAKKIKSVTRSAKKSIG